MTNINRKSGQSILMVATSQMGKTTMANKMVANVPRLLIYDPKCHPDDFRGVPATHDIEEIMHALKNTGKGPARWRFMDKTMQDFDLFCSMAQWWCEEHGPMTSLIDELAELVDSGKARGSYGTLIRTAKGYGMDTLLLSQSAVEIDNSCLRNADGFIAFHMTRPQDREYIAKYMNLPKEKLENLDPYYAVARMGHHPAKLIKPDGSKVDLT